jgi:hypothetical protein
MTDECGRAPPKRISIDFNDQSETVLSEVNFMWSVPTTVSGEDSVEVNSAVETERTIW